MKGIFVNENSFHYAWLIVNGYKEVETRRRNMLSALIGERVAVIRTKRGEKPSIIGYVTIVSSEFCPASEFNKYFGKHFVLPDSEYACDGKGKWFYWLDDAYACVPQPLPENAIRHGRSWCEF